MRPACVNTTVSANLLCRLQCLISTGPRDTSRSHRDNHRRVVVLPSSPTSRIRIHREEETDGTPPLIHPFIISHSYPSLPPGPPVPALLAYAEGARLHHELRLVCSGGREQRSHAQNRREGGSWEGRSAGKGKKKRPSVSVIPRCGCETVGV
ncbi:Hypothetical predicted protein [Xyrichtys novacula]|uniref:Uncharacterized protein n=1 Tax=Xyrichtys novacula TaxID=13765 RepID=A0AAV1FCL2_XYRNO|nr:Hypothetical predicted protein [Xyrichtys novacula]